ncbi:gliding motility-associated-like protein [Nonlabens xylanidelens]|uniref:Gliding motility-associated-like protein n=1 Tax=Nonlabens xylanidelens TaxID=191564 RepID=A0A2S6IMI7_9FLAO|nr:T9SS type B sorting domain-containing protein [Nonlabens xylanidelens]PPK95472.1 gliding motility-associated-like protein [Nonlabens xylanidelens]PQJ22288.1 PKD domain-containing protein [Nonlabens xylanidelens]
MKKLFLLFFLSIPILSFGQLEAAWWFFGDNASVDFNSGAPVAAPAGSLATAEGCSTISDECGILQMYSDGQTIWNRNGVAMANGTGLSGNGSSAQSAIIIPDLGVADRYFVITISSFAGLRYSIVDMTLNGGLGDVIAGRRDILIQADTQEKVTATLSDNGTFYWIVTFENGGEYSAYPAAGGIILASRGVDSTLPVTSSLTDARGYIRLSPDGSKIANTSVEPAGTAYLTDFDTATGVVSNPVALTTSSNIIDHFYGAEFSPDSQLIYLNANSASGGNGCSTSVNREILQYNINSGGGWNSTPFVFAANGANNSERGALQLGIDGKIYHARACQPWLGVIRSPDSVGAAANYIDDGIPLNNNSREGLPPFITSFFEPSFNSYESVAGGGSGGASINQVNFCDQTPIQFEASTADFCPTSTVTWNFGDGSPTSTVLNPIHTFPAPGVYTVTLVVRNGGFRFTASQDITIYANPIANPVADVFLCDSDGDGIETRDLTIAESPEVLDTQIDPNFMIEYFLSQNAADNNVSSITMPYDFPVGTTTVYVRITNEENATSSLCFDTGFFDVIVASGSGATRPTDLVVCDDDNDGISTFDLTTTETEVLNGLPATAFTISYHVTAADASTASNPIMNPTSYTNTTPNMETIFIRLQDNSPGGCTSTTEVDLFIWSTPTANAVMDIAVCDAANDNSEIITLSDFDAEVLGTQTDPDYVITYHISQADADTGANDLPNSYDLTATTTLFVRIDNLNNEPCFDTTSFELRLDTQPVANPIATYRLCDDISNNNSEVFDLVTRNPEILLTQAAADFNIEYFTSQADADLGTVGGATAVNDMYSSAGQTMYVRIENVINTSCFDTTTFDLIVDDLPVANTVADLVLCDDETNDGTEDIDLTQFDTAVLNGQTSPNFVISYHPTQADADNDTAEITTAYTVNLGTTTVFVRVDNSDNMTCASTTPINIILDAQAIANPVTEYRLCDDMTNDGLEDFDLSTKDAEVLGTQTATNFTIEYFTSQVDADLGSVGGATPLTTIYNSGSTTLFVRIQTNSNTGCYDTEMFDIFVDPLPLAGTPADIIVCDDISNDGTEDVNLSQFDAEILNGQTNTSFNVTYHATQADADNNVSPLASPYAVTSSTPNLFARVDNADNDMCYSTTTFQFVISPTPTANTVADMITCDDPGNDGSEVFDLSLANSQVLDGQNPNDFNITFHPSQNDADMNTAALPTMYASSTTTPETIFVRIESAINPVCADFTSFTLTVSVEPTAGIGADIVGCDDVSNDGFEEFDFSSQDAAIYNGQSTTDFDVTYHVSQADADNDVNALTFPYTNTSRSQTIYARIENTSNTDCYDVSSFLIEVFARPVIADQGPYTICAGVAENIDAGAGFSSYLWSTGATSRTIDVASGGDYTVTVTNADGCDSTATITVVESDVAVIERIDVGQFEVNTNTLTAIVTGSGDYEFSLDNFVYQDSQRFNNLYPGFYTIFVRDKNGCGTVSMDAVIIGGPPYFTPNQDGYHDTWQVIAVETIPDATIYIFDRYGKLLKQVSPTGAGWDGNYNGTPMPSSDYWYLVELSDGRSFKGHFALKR